MHTHTYAHIYRFCDSYSFKSSVLCKILLIHICPCICTNYLSLFSVLIIAGGYVIVQNHNDDYQRWHSSSFLGKKQRSLTNLLDWVGATTPQ